MANRKDGRATRLKVLNAACAVFAEKGFHAARVADICRRAGANVASVNYYFGDKASLYREAWLHAVRTFRERGRVDLQSGSPGDALREYIHLLTRQFATDGEMGQFSRLYLRELVQPTGLIQDAWREMIDPRRRVLHRIIRSIAGPDADEAVVLFCELSVVNQCRALLTIKRSDLEHMLGQPLSPEVIVQLADHIADFSLAGIQAARSVGESVE
jgi:AcrR family transcriptional regulator